MSNTIHKILIGMASTESINEINDGLSRLKESRERLQEVKREYALMNEEADSSLAETLKEAEATRKRVAERGKELEAERKRRVPILAEIDALIASQPTTPQDLEKGLKLLRELNPPKRESTIEEVPRKITLPPLD